MPDMLPLESVVRAIQVALFLADILAVAAQFAGRLGAGGGRRGDDRHRDGGKQSGGDEFPHDVPPKTTGDPLPVRHAL